MSIQTEDIRPEVAPQAPQGLWKTGYTNVDYELPPVVGSVINGLQGRYQSAAVVSGLLAGAAAQLYTFFKTPSNYLEGTSQGHKDIIVALCYVAMLLNGGATVSVFLMMATLGQVQYDAATPSTWCRPERSVPPFVADLTYGGSGVDFIAGKRLGDVDLIAEGIPQLLKSYFKRHRVFGRMQQHWIICFAGGVLSITLAIVVYGAVQEPTAVRAITAVVALYAIFPLLGWAYYRLAAYAWRLLKWCRPSSPRPPTSGVP